MWKLLFEPQGTCIQSNSVVSTLSLRKLLYLCLLQQFPSQSVQAHTISRALPYIVSYFLMYCVFMLLMNVSIDNACECPNMYLCYTPVALFMCHVLLH